MLTFWSKLALRGTSLAASVQGWQGKRNSLEDKCSLSTQLVQADVCAGRKTNRMRSEAWTPLAPILKGAKILKFSFTYRMKCISQLIPNTTSPLYRLFLVARNMPDYRIITVPNLSRHYFYNTSTTYNFKLFKCTQRYVWHWLYTERQVYLTVTMLRTNWLQQRCISAFKHHFIEYRHISSGSVRQQKSPR